MAAQAAVVTRRAPMALGHVEAVLIERIQGRGMLVGRTSQQAPGIDGVVRCRGVAAPGDVVSVRITGAERYDLHGEVLAPRAAGRAVDTPPATP